MKKKIVKRASNKTIKTIVEDKSKNTIVPTEPTVSDVPKNFVIRCSKCCWSRLSSGISTDLADLHEVKLNCNSCGKARKFQCPKCGLYAFMKRIKGNLQK